MVLGGPQVGHGSQKLCLSMILQLHCQNRSGDYPKTVSQAISIWRANSLYVYVNWSYHLRFFFFSSSKFVPFVAYIIAAAFVFTFATNGELGNPSHLDCISTTSSMTMDKLL